MKYTFINGYDDIAPKSGIYVFACQGDNHIVYEMYMLKKGERLYKYFEEDYAHSDGWLGVRPVAYHYAEYYPYPY